MQDRSYEKLRQLHPCLGRTAGNTGRIHLPVSPSCNLSCRYCRRALTLSEERPGTASRILPVKEVPEVIEKALSLCPDLTTVGIAGPGEALASPHALEAFRLTERYFPEMIKCLSTNGLLLAEKADDLASLHVDAVTVTVNAVNPKIQKLVNDSVFYHGRRIEGEEAAELLIHNQLEGIRKAAAEGITVKINIVLIPGINDSSIEETAKKASAAGAKICNIIPLIPQADMAERKAPDCAELEKARMDAGQYLDIFRHCRHCRADAAGKLQEPDLRDRIYGNRLFDEETFSHG